MIEEKGLAGLSLREVARVAGVSHTAPYRHFQNKADLLAAIAQVGFEQLVVTRQDLQTEEATSRIKPGSTLPGMPHRDTIELAVTTWSGIHGLTQLISGGYLSRLAATERQVETLGNMVSQLLLTGILMPDEK